MCHLLRGIFTLHVLFWLTLSICDTKNKQKKSAKLRSVVISGNVVESIAFCLFSCVCMSYVFRRSGFIPSGGGGGGLVSGHVYSVSSHSALYNRSSLSHRFANTDEALRNVSAIFAFKSDSWNSIFGSKANFMEHLALLGYVSILIDPAAFWNAASMTTDA